MRNTVVAAKAALIVGAALLASASQAAVYTSKSSFLASNNGVSVENFDSPTCGSVCSTPGFTGFSASGNNPRIIAAGLLGNTSQYIIDDSFGGVLFFGFLPTINAVGFDLAGGYSGDETLTVSVFNGVNLIANQDFTVAGVDDFSGFVGFNGLGTITGIAIQTQNSGQFVNVDNLYFGSVSVSAVPEPTSASLVGLGLMGGVFFARRKKYQAR